MWCDNCLLIFPLRAGAMAWVTLIALYNIAGSIILFKYGQFLFFDYPEAQIYGGIGMGVAAICLLTVIGLSNSSYMFSRLCFFVWPLLLVLVAVRAGFMMFQLDRQQSKIIWECNNGGQVWGNGTETTASGTTTSTTTMPSGFCSAGFHSLYIAFVFSLAIDFCLQVYAYFLTWRFKKRLEHYTRLGQQDKYMYGA